MSSSDLPDGWTLTKVGDLLPPGGIFDGPFGSKLKTKDYTASGVRVVRLENVGHLEFIADKETFVSVEKYAELERHTVGEGDIMFASFVDKEVRVCRLPEIGPAIAKADCFCLRPDQDVVDPDLLVYFLASKQSHAAFAERVQGATRPRVNTKHVKTYQLGLPPLPEQRRIVARLDAIEAHRRAAKEKLDQLPDLLDRYRQSVLAAAFRGDLTAAWREAHPDTEPASALLERIRAERHRRWIEDKAQKATARAEARDAKKGQAWTEADRTARLDKERAKAAKKYKPAPSVGDQAPSDLPDGWVWTTMDQVIETIQTGPFGSALHKSDYVEGGTPLVNPSNIVDGRIVPDSTKTVPDDVLERLSGFKLKEADIVLGRRGEMGRCALVTETESGWLCGTGSLILRAETQVSESYLDALIRSPAVRFALEEASVGSTMSNLNQGVLKALAVALPPRDEQDEVVSQIAACSDRIGGIVYAIESGAAHIEKLRQATLARAFRGELVPTDAALARRSFDGEQERGEGAPVAIPTSGS